MVEDDPFARAERLRQLTRGTTTAAALAYFDSCPPMPVDALSGAWRGAGIPTGHSLDGLLEAYGWLGKRFDGPESAYPLLFQDEHGQFNANPTLVRVGPAARLPALAHHPLAQLLGRRLIRLARTSAPRARVRTVEHRGVATATMSYDALPINDHFRKVDDDTVIGLMDSRGVDRPFFFMLTRA